MPFAHRVALKWQTFLVHQSELLLVRVQLLTSSVKLVLICPSLCCAVPETYLTVTALKPLAIIIYLQIQSLEGKDTGVSMFGYKKGVKKDETRTLPWRNSQSSETVMLVVRD